MVAHLTASRTLMLWIAVELDAIVEDSLRQCGSEFVSCAWPALNPQRTATDTRSEQGRCLGTRYQVILLLVMETLSSLCACMSWKLSLWPQNVSWQKL